MSDLFTPAAIKEAVQQAIGSAPLPADKRHAILIAPSIENGEVSLKAVYAQRFGDHWQVAGEADYHGSGDVGAGVSVVASW